MDSLSLQVCIAWKLGIPYCQHSTNKGIYASDQVLHNRWSLISHYNAIHIYKQQLATLWICSTSKTYFQGKSRTSSRWQFLVSNIATHFHEFHWIYILIVLLGFFYCSAFQHKGQKQNNKDLEFSICCFKFSITVFQLISPVNGFQCFWFVRFKLGLSNGLWLTFIDASCIMTMILVKSLDLIALQYAKCSTPWMLHICFLSRISSFNFDIIKSGAA